MRKSDLLQQLNNHFKDLQSTSRRDTNARVAAAMTISEFESNELSLRAVEVSLAKARAYNFPADDLEKQLASLLSMRGTLERKYNLDLSPRYSCPVCKDSGFVNGQPCLCRQKAYVTLLKRNCGLTTLSSFTFDNNKLASSNAPQAPVVNKLYSLMRKFCDNFDTTHILTLLLMGEVGIGKTSLVAATANCLLERGKIVLYLTAFELSDIFRKHHLSGVISDDIAFDSLFDCDLLIIDDLGTEPTYNNITMQYLFSTIDSRIISNKKTFVCTNLLPENFIARYGERALSRLTDKRYALRLGYISGADLRGKKL